MNNKNLQEEKNDSQPAATPLAAPADSHQPGDEESIPDENNDPQVPATMHLATAPICASNEDIEEEKMSPQLTAMPLPAGSRRLDDYDYDANEIELDLPSEGSVLVVDSSRVPADAQEVSRIELKKLVNNDSIKISFRTSNPDEGASLVELSEPVEVPSLSSRTLLFTGKASFT